MSDQPDRGPSADDTRALRSDAWFEEIMRVLPDVIVAVSPQGDVLMCSEAVRRVLGYAPEELIGLNLRDLPALDAEGRALVAAEMSRVLRGERQGAVLISFLHRDGSRRWLEARSAIVQHPDGRPVIQAILRDTTERLLAEQRLRAIIDNTNDIIIIMDAQGVILFENAAVERVLGYGPGERVGRSILEFAHPDDRPAAAERLATLASADASVALTLRFRHKNGTWRDLETHGRNMLQVPAIHGILGVARDITERLRLQERLEAVERLDSIGRLAGGIAHDFNNLLAVVFAAAEHLRESDRADVRSDREIDVIVEAAERARQLTSKLLTFARRQFGEPGVVDAAASLVASERFLRRLMGEASTLTIDVPDRAVRVPLSPAQFEQVLLNLAANARDAMPEGGAFAIRLSCLASTDTPPAALGMGGDTPIAQLTVSDTGSGMSPEVAGRVFEPFYTTKEQGKGTGLGLSMVYGLVRGAKGDIRIASEPGRGTTVEVFLPMLPPVQAAPTPPAPSVLRGGSETVLVVEDNDDVRRLTMRTLQQAGY
ncbi:MAG: PAS domain S-box protein, partial [Vicinamibacterales bacterium]